MLGHGAIGQFAIGQVGTIIETISTDKWFVALSEPKRFLRGLGAHSQQFLFQHPTPSPFVATGWFDWLSEPVRVKPILQPDYHPFLFEQLPPVIMAWFMALSEPVRLPPRLKEGLQWFLSRIPFIPTSYTASLNTTEQGDIPSFSLYLFNQIKKAFVSIFKR